MTRTRSTTPQRARRSPGSPRPANRLAYRRLHGLGNDYVFVRGRDLRHACGVEAVRALSDRHRGVGGDGVISIELGEDASPAATPRLRMRMWNADGSEGGMCGNGVRGAVRFAIEEELVEFEESATSREVVVEIGDRAVRCRIVEISPRFLVAVDMGACDFGWAAVPFRPTRPLVAAPPDTLRSVDELDALGASGNLGSPGDLAASLRGWSVASMGNPHLVLMVSSRAEIDSVPLTTLGPLLEHAAAFPARTNVHLAKVETRTRFQMRTWERGTGPTLACGSGACAAFGILHRCGDLDAAATAVLDGGALDLATGAAGRIEMTGPSETCCTGIVDLDALLAARRSEPATIGTPIEIELDAEATT